MRLRYDATRLADTNTIAKRLANLLQLHFKRQEDAICLTLFLSAPLGGGKSTFVRFLLTALGWQASAPSPTFNLIHSYDLSGLTLRHLDGYRLNAEEFAQLGPENLVGPNTLLVVEWPEKIGALLKPDLTCLIQHIGKEEHSERRRIEFWAKSQVGRQLLREMKRHTKEVY